MFFARNAFGKIGKKYYILLQNWTRGLKNYFQKRAPQNSWNFWRIKVGNDI